MAVPVDRCVMPLRLCLPVTLTLLSVVPAALASPKSKPAIQALYPTKAEAEQAAKRFHCSGAHRMGTQWMPCATHNDNQGTASGHDHDSH